MKIKDKIIANSKVIKFRKDNPDQWIEGLDERKISHLKYLTESKFGKILFPIFYWKKGKSYVINSTLDGVCFCVSKTYWNEVSQLSKSKK